MAVIIISSLNMSQLYVHDCNVMNIHKTCDFESLCKLMHVHTKA